MSDLTLCCRKPVQAPALCHFLCPLISCEIMVGKCSSSPFLLRTCVQLPWSVGSFKHHPPSPPGTLRTNSGNQACVFSLVTTSVSIEKLWCLLLCLCLFLDALSCSVHIQLATRLRNLHCLILMENPKTKQTNPNFALCTKCYTVK